MSAPTLDQLLAQERADDTTGYGLRCRVGEHEDPAVGGPGVPVSCTCWCHARAVAARAALAVAA